MLKVLTIETTCDETAAAVVTDELEVLGSVVASQEALHQKFSGVVPEIAARAHLERILPVIDETIRQAKISLTDLDAIAVATTPGLAGSLLVGLCAAKALCVALQKPLVAINHLHAHIYACRVFAKRDIFPCVGFIVSGGHTTLYDCQGPTDFHHLGGTIDDAAGEAFDKVASMLGLPYPGGPTLSRVAESGNPKAFDFPRGLGGPTGGLDFSFSGLKTAVRYAIAGPGRPNMGDIHLEPQQIADLAASFQEAVVDSLVRKSSLAMRQTRSRRLCVGGGVAANKLLRARLEFAAKRGGWELLIAPPELCTDNAVMGAIAIERIKAGAWESLELDVVPGLVRLGRTPLSKT